MAIEFPCTGCAEVFVVAEVTAGRKGKCPKCALVNVVPRAKPAIQPAPENAAADTAPVPESKPPSPTANGDAAKPRESAAVTWVPPAKRKKRQVSWLVVGGLVGIILICLAIGGYLLFAGVV